MGVVGRGGGEVLPEFGLVPGGEVHVGAHVDGIFGADAAVQGF